MTPQKTQGLIAAPPTPFTPDGEVHLDLIPLQCASLRASGVVGAFVNGTTGEGFSLTVEERMAAAERWVEAAPGGFRVIVHVAHLSPVSARQLASHAARIGASAIAEIGPVYYRPASVEALAEYAAQTAAHAPGLPYYYYHMPSMSGVHFPMIDFLRKAESTIPSLAGIKYTHEDLVDCQMCLEFKDGRYDILYGRDETLLCGLSLGCQGAVGSTYNLMAPLYIRLMNAFDSGDLAEARRLQSLSIRIIQILAKRGCFFSALKEAMKLLGLDLGGVREPLSRIAPADIPQLKDELTEAGFFEVCSKGID